MKFTPQTLIGLVFVILGLLFVIAGAMMKIWKYADGWLTGNNIIILGMFVELIGIFIAANQLSKNLKK